MATLSPNPAMQDLKITFQESALVFPSQETERKTLFLSNIDQFLNFDIPTIRFFSSNPGFPPEIVAKRLKMALEKVLVPYDFVAGRLKWNSESSRLEIDCNAAGAGFVVASSELSLDEIGDLACPNLGFQQLAVQRLNNLGPNYDDQPMCTLQVTSFKCGGFAIGMSNNHILLDGLAAKMFQENLASQAFDDKPLPFIPVHDRHCLTARSPPLVTFPHPEFLLPELPLLEPPNLVIKQELDFKVLKLTSNDINLLKAKAETDNPNAAKITTYNVVAALIWRCKALASCQTEDDKDRESSLLNAVDLRSRLNPPLPPEFCGNAILLAYSSAQCGVLEKSPFSKVVEMVSEGIGRVTDEYARSAIDFVEIYKGIPYGDMIVTSWLRLGFDEVVFPWGKPVFCGPVVNDMDSLCWAFPAVDGVNILIQRPPQEMERFQFHFHNFLIN
ncbi:hypothetical protein BUALT_Bualt16G0128600 [Buddleja alternifolia]|uniref:Omega-hydroxypalmitate O-feruloyl transferase n=1 Tax=Buddleja alternifolia TaxID=168488 RepID=A0AAV6W970_9LAMI|nr:hypothetical protein BUALT_Bualt16G0128600 [Buddleja alternifolia]